MSRIQSTTGLISGIPIADTVEQLMKIEARPRDLLASRSKDLQNQQVAVTELTATVIAVQLAVRKLAVPSLFTQRNVTSSNKNLLIATANGSPAVGSYRFTPIRQATAQHQLSTGFATKDEPIGAGEINLQFGGFVDQGVTLSELNGGEGVQRGKIRITDRSGASATVDLRFAQTVDDVLNAINSTDAIQVTAAIEGDRITLTDRSGSTTANLKVQEVSGGSTAADLGLAAINVAATSASGQDVLKLYNGAGINHLNDGNGLSIRSETADLQVTLRDGTSLEIDLHRKAKTESFAQATTTGDPDAQIKLTAKTKGAAFDGVRILYVNDGGVTQGNETVVYDDSDPDNKTLTVNIAAGATTADDVINAITNDPAASTHFIAERATGSDGTGVVTDSDTGVTSGGAAQALKKEKNLGEILETINAIDPNRLKAEIAPDGDRLVLTDLTSNLGGTFAVTNKAGGTLAEDLGLTGTAVGGTITGDRLTGGLKSTLLRTFNGGSGLGTLGALQITDRSGAAASVDLSGAETLDDVIQAINDSGLGIEASVNSSRNGIQIEDTTGAVASNLIIANGDGTNTATKLKLAVNAAVDEKNSGTLQRQTISENTLLASLNGGKGVARTSFFVSDSTGSTTVVRLDDEEIQTVGDVLDAINALSIGVEARLSPTGDGIQVIDTANGTGLPKVADVGNGTAAKDLHLTGVAEEIEIDGDTKKVVTGSQAFKVTVSETDTLQDVVTKINALSTGFAASILSDGSGQTPHRLSIQSSIIGNDGNLQIDSNYEGLRFDELVRGHDALLEVGAGGSGGVIISSKTDKFENAVTGIDVTIAGESTDPVTVSVSQSDSSIVSAVQLFVDQYNKMRDKLATQTSFNTTDFKAGVLFGSHEALRVDSDLSTLLSGRFFGAGDIHSLKELGLDLTDAGKLTFDAAKLQEKYAADPEAVSEFFTKDKNGFADRLDDKIESLAGIKNSLLVNRAQALQSRIEVYTERIDQWNIRLAKKKDSLLLKFYRLEESLGKLQTSISAVSSIQALPPLGSVAQ